MSNQVDSLALAKSFDGFFAAKGYQILEPVRITSKIDKTVYLTNGATNLFKQYLGKGESLCVRQRSMRTQILNDYYDPGSETEYPSYFVSYGVYVPADALQRLIDDTIVFHTQLGFLLNKMRLRVSAQERFLTDFAYSSALSENVTPDPKDGKFDHVYGENLYGRAIKLDYYQESIHRYKNLGYILIIKKGNELLGAEYASSDQLIMMRMHEIRYGVSASLIGDVLETDTFEKRRFADCVVGSAHLMYEGITPNSSNTNGRTLKKYIAGLLYFGNIVSIETHDITSYVDRYLEMEYNANDAEKSRVNAILVKSLLN